MGCDSAARPHQLLASGAGPLALGAWLHCGWPFSEPMGSVPLLTGEDEIKLAKRMDKGNQAMLVRDGGDGARFAPLIEFGDGSTSFTPNLLTDEDIAILQAVQTRNPALRARVADVAAEPERVRPPALQGEVVPRVAGADEVGVDVLKERPCSHASHSPSPFPRWQPRPRSRRLRPTPRS